MGLAILSLCPLGSREALCNFFLPGLAWLEQLTRRLASWLVFTPTSCFWCHCRENSPSLRLSFSVCKVEMKYPLL